MNNHKGIHRATHEQGDPVEIIVMELGSDQEKMGCREPKHLKMRSGELCPVASQNWTQMAQVCQFKFIIM